MQITIIVDDKNVGVDGQFFTMPELDWSRFNGDPKSPWDDIHAVQFNVTDGQGHVEYKPVKTQQVTRPNIVPPQWRIGPVEFDREFGWVVEAYSRRATEVPVEQVAPVVQPEPVQPELATVSIVQQAPPPYEPEPGYDLPDEPEEPIEFEPVFDVGEPAPVADGSWGSILAGLNDGPMPTEPPPPVEPPPVPPTDDEIRAAAILMIKEAAANLTALSNRDQIKYELAMQAKNGSAYAQSLFVSEAKDMGISVNDLAGQVLGRRKDHEALIMRVSAVEARVLSAIGGIAIDDLPYAVEAAIDELKKGASNGAVD